MVSCYEIIKRKQCVSYLKKDVLNIINQKVILDVRKTIDLPYNENVYFDLGHVKGRTYEAGIRLNLKTEHISYNKLYTHMPHKFNYEKFKYEKSKTLPKIVFNKNIFNEKELVIQETKIVILKDIYDYVIKYKEKLLAYEENLSKFENDKYKIRVKNDLHTVLVKSNNDNYNVLLDNYVSIDNFNIDTLIKEIDKKMNDNENREFLDILFISDEYNLFLSKLKTYKGIDIRVDISKNDEYYQNNIRFKLYISERIVYNEKLERNINDFIEKAKECEIIIQNFIKSYSITINLVNKINSCKNNFWKAQFSFDYNRYLVIEVDQKYFFPKRYLTLEKIRFEDFNELTEQDIVKHLEIGMKKVLNNMERCGYRVMEVRE